MMNKTIKVFSNFSSEIIFSYYHNLKELVDNKDYNNVIKKIYPIICEMEPKSFSYCQDKNKIIK